MSPILAEFQRLRPAGGFKTILADPPWEYESRSSAGMTKSAQNHYDCQDLEWMCSLPVAALAGEDCALFMWCTWPLMPIWLRVITAWGFEYSGLAWEWIKYNQETGKYAFGPGYGTRKNLEPCLLATRGAPSLRQPLSFFGIGGEKAESHSVRDFMFAMPLNCIRAVRREHSRKPEEQYERIETMFDGPMVELFSRSSRKGWAAWGNETGKFG